MLHGAIITRREWKKRLIIILVYSRRLWPGAPKAEKENLKAFSTNANLAYWRKFFIRKLGEEQENLQMS